MNRDRFKQIATAHDLLDVQNERQVAARLASLEDFARHVYLEAPTRYNRFWMPAAFGLLVVSTLSLCTITYVQAQADIVTQFKDMRIALLEQKVTAARTADANIDGTCVQWMFNSSFRKVKSRICGGKK